VDQGLGIIQFGISDLGFGIFVYKVLILVFKVQVLVFKVPISVFKVPISVFKVQDSAGGFSRLSAPCAAISHAVYGVVSVRRISGGRFSVLTDPL
jgi:hypothetical protein